jgi:hypothetical protein
MNEEILELTPLPLPHNYDEKMFQDCDEETGEPIGELYSYSDWVQRIKDISGINDDLLGSYANKSETKH